MSNSTHQCSVVPVLMEPHPNADTLSIVKVWDYTVVVKTSDWEGRKIAAYLPPDSLVDTNRPEFNWLKDKAGTDGKYRIKAMKMRGIVSFGLLVPVSESIFNIGDDAALYLGVEHWNPPEDKFSTGDEVEKPPKGFEHISKYDLDAFKKYKNVFMEGEEVFISEKIHGSNGKFVYSNGQQYCGSRSEWKRENKDNMWWRVFYKYPQIERFCKNNEDLILRGEVYGWVSELRYGAKQGELFFRAFDIQTKDGKFIDVDQFLGLCEEFQIPVVPTIYRGPLDFNKVFEYAEGQTLIPNANHVREGCVIKPVKERWDKRCGRVALKLVGAGYYLKTK